MSKPKADLTAPSLGERKEEWETDEAEEIEGAGDAGEEGEVLDKAAVNSSASAAPEWYTPLQALVACAIAAYELLVVYATMGTGTGAGV